MLLFTFVLEDPKPKPPKRKAIIIDETLFKRIGKSDMKAFDELYHLTERTMYAFTLSLSNDHQEALDLMQDTYVKILSAAHLYKPMGKPLAWMFTIAKNIFYTTNKRNKKIVHIDTEVIANDMRFSHIIDTEDKIVLEGALQVLTGEEKQIVLLYAVSGMKHKEIADSLGLKLSTTLSKYHRALKKLREYLEDKGVRL